jgi:hypothetical protein
LSVLTTAVVAVVNTLGVNGQAG